MPPLTVQHEIKKHMKIDRNQSLDMEFRRILKHERVGGESNYTWNNGDPKCNGIYISGRATKSETRAIVRMMAFVDVERILS